jgi:hypothetical protein
MSNFIISRIFCRERGIKSVSVILSALAVYNVNTLYFNARSTFLTPKLSLAALGTI